MAPKADVAARVKKQVLADVFCMLIMATGGCRRLPCEAARICWHVFLLTVLLVFVVP